MLKWYWTIVEAVVVIIIAVMLVASIQFLLDRASCNQLQAAYPDAGIEFGGEFYTSWKCWLPEENVTFAGGVNDYHILNALGY